MILSTFLWWSTGTDVLLFEHFADPFKVLQFFLAHTSYQLVLCGFEVGLTDDNSYVFVCGEMIEEIACADLLAARFADL